MVKTHIDAKVLKNEIKDFMNSRFFVCGPLPMMELVEKLLVENGVRKDLIFTEKFSLK